MCERFLTLPVTVVGKFDTVTGHLIPAHFLNVRKILDTTITPLPLQLLPEAIGIDFTPSVSAPFSLRFTPVYFLRETVLSCSSWNYALPLYDSLNNKDFYRNNY